MEMNELLFLVYCTGILGLGLGGRTGGGKERERERDTKKHRLFIYLLFFIGEKYLFPSFNLISFSLYFKNNRNNTK
jgi:hypothetical protein